MYKHSPCSSISLPQYSNCQCLGERVTATSGFCPLECNNYVWYIGIFSFFVLIHSTSEVGSMLLTLRCVHAKDKAMALGLIQFAIGLFGKRFHPPFDICLTNVYVLDSKCTVPHHLRRCGRLGLLRLGENVR